MVLDYTTFYVEANIVCIIIFALMLTRELRTVGIQTKQMIFVNITISHMLYFAADIIGTLILADIIPRNRVSTSIVNILIAVLLSTITGCWFVYVELSQGEKYITGFKNRVCVLIPAMIEAALMLFYFLVIPDAVIDDACNMTELYYITFLAVPALYVAVSAVRSLVRAFRKENYAVRNSYIVCAVYPLIITIFGVMETLWLEAPVFCFGCSIMMLYVYIINLNDQVSIDELTRLNNRTQLKKYITNEAFKPGSEKQIRYILMIDLNKFKLINDQYGHVEGDNALKRTADALKSACGSNPLKTFIARFGGDEFIIIAKTDNEEQVRDLSRSIKETLVRMNEESGAKYELTCCVGYCPYSGDVAAFQAAMAKADEALYEEKAALGTLRQ
ncbi:MAG: GGDEF domain-containing protein [Clostridiales bacterium]|nr:GGDEF domain-containing protein [Clostridiales bacterium]